MKNKVLSVADFFCGAGGFSEGFRQKGFEVKFALDFWKPAVDTHELNHPNCKHALMNILELNTPEKIDEVVPDTDIIIGSPPCVSFSGSNKAGKADKSLGIQLIESYLRIVAWKKSKGVVKHWLMENVPNSKNFTKSKYTWKELGLPGKGPDLKIPVRDVYNAADYGTPQGRKRFVCGNYPVPKITHNLNNYNTTENVLKCLGNPIKKNGPEVIDPTYGFKIKSDKLTDHHYDARIGEYEWKRAKRLKKDHGFMGKMSFPENLNRPSRTVMATMSASTRESMLFNSYDKKGNQNGYRLPTIREIATFMSFPITYQFEANNESSKYRLVGNAVCSKLASEFAHAIAKKEKLKMPDKFPSLPEVMPSFNLNFTKRKIKEPGTKKATSKFAVHVPYTKIRSFRAEINNHNSDFNNENFKWNSVLHQGTGIKAFKGNISQELLTNVLNNFSQFSDFKEEVMSTFNTKVDPNELQKRYVNYHPDGPYSKLEQIKLIVDNYFPSKKYKDNLIYNVKNKLNINRDYIPVKVAAALYACNHFVNQTK
jgi:DNA (cytosine-5)-methyltransferase 1